MVGTSPGAAEKDGDVDAVREHVDTAIAWLPEVQAALGREP